MEPEILIELGSARDNQRVRDAIDTVIGEFPYVEFKNIRVTEAADGAWLMHIDGEREPIRIAELDQMDEYLVGFKNHFRAVAADHARRHRPRIGQS